MRRTRRVAEMVACLPQLAVQIARRVVALARLFRQQGNLVADASSAIQRMQKALIEMNVPLSSVLSDLSGVSGMSILGAILKGERDPWK